MDNARELTLSVLGDLIRTCKEEHILFKTASGKILNPFLKNTLDNCAEEKIRNIHKLEIELERLGGKYDEKDLELSPKIIEEIESFNDDRDILTKCEMIDEIVLRKYSTAMNGDILWEVVPLVAKQYFASVNLHCRIMYSFRSDLPNSVYS
jgi:hypothetical protein